MPKTDRLLAVSGALVAFTAATDADSWARPSLVSAVGGNPDPMNKPVRIDGYSADNRISAQPGSGQVIVTDAAGAIAGTGCLDEDGFTVTCTTTSTLLGGRLGAGADVITISGGLRMRLYAGRGADRATGSAAIDWIFGESGPDQLRGMGGDDLLDGSLGLDELRGEAGNDALRAQNGDVDALIDCGRGVDHVRIDRNMDPEPTRCEFIRRR